MIDMKIDGETAFVDMVPAEGKFTLLDVETLKELIAIFRSDELSCVKTIRLRGHGGCFAVGADLKTLSTYSGFDAKWFSRLGNTLFNRMRSMPQVIIAEIDGFCMGGGVDFASACDIRLATAKSKFAHPGAKLGIITGFGGTQSVPRLMKSGFAARFFFSGNVFDAEYMQQSGFLLKVMQDKTMLDEESGKLCMMINSRSAELLGDFKASLETSKFKYIS